MAKGLERNVSDKELQAILQQHSIWLETRDSDTPRGRRADLAYAVLTGTRALQQADLREANLQGAILDGADLSGCRLNRANIRDASFRRSRLRQADLSESQGFETADWRNADTAEIRLTPAHLAEQADSLQSRLDSMAAAISRLEHEGQDNSSEKQQQQALTEQYTQLGNQIDAATRPYQEVLKQQQTDAAKSKWQQLKIRCADYTIIGLVAYEKAILIVSYILMGILVGIITLLIEKKEETEITLLSKILASAVLGIEFVVFSTLAAKFASVAGAVRALLAELLVLAVAIMATAIGALYFSNTYHLTSTFLCLLATLSLIWSLKQYINITKKEIFRYNQAHRHREEHTYSADTHRTYQNEKQQLQQQIQDLQDKLSGKNSALDERIQAAKNTLATALKNADDSIASHKQSAKICGRIGIGLFVLDFFALIAASGYMVSKLSAIGLDNIPDNLAKIPGWVVLLYTFPIAATMLIANALLRHQKKLLDEVRHFSGMKHQVELYSGLLEASQHAAASRQDHHDASQYVQDTFSKILDRLLRNDLPADSQTAADSDGIAQEIWQQLEKKLYDNHLLKVVEPESEAKSSKK